MAGIDVPLSAVRGLVVQEMSQVLWVLESHVFAETHGPIREAILCLGHEFVDWDDNWWSEGVPAFDHDIPIVFRGSLGNAALIEEQLDVCECDNKFHLLELNPFGGADLYACDADVVVNAITKLVD